MVSSTMVKPKVEVAFTGTDTTPTWTDVTSYVRNVSLDRGRNREVDQFDAGKLSFEVKNADRRFDPEHASGPYFGNLLPMKPVRVTATYSAVTYNLFRGYIDGWPQEYVKKKYAFSRVTATDAFKVLNRQIITSTFRTTILADDPDHWYPLSDPVDSFQVLDIGSSPTPGAAAGGDFGASSIVATDSGTSFNINENFRDLIETNPPQTSTYTIEIWFRKAPMNTTDGIAAFLYNQWGGYGVPTDELLWAWVDDGAVGDLGQLFVYAGTAVAVQSVAPVDDGVTHLLSIVVATTNSKVYLDGVQLGSQAKTSSAPTSRSIQYGQVDLGPLYGFLYNGELTIQHIMIWDSTALSAGQVAEHWAVGGDGYSGDLSGVRVTRILDSVGWPATLRDIGTGDVTLGSAPIGDRSDVLALLRQVDATESGGLYIDELGRVKFCSRSAPFSESRSVTSQATFGDSGSELDYHDIAFSFDETLIRNFVTGQRQGGTVQQASDATSIAAYHTLSYNRPTTIELYDTDVLNACQFIVANYKDAATRVESLKVTPQRSPTTLWPQVLGRKIGDRITVNRRPQAVGSVISKELIIEGISHDITPDSWVTTFAVSNVLGEGGGVTGYLILNNATRGTLNANRLL